MSSYTSSIVGIVLYNSVTQNPSTLVAGGYVTNILTQYSGDAVYGRNSAAWDFVNFGTIKATATASSGVDLTAGGTVTNAVGALIIGVAHGVSIGGRAGTVSNSGTIKSTGTAFSLGVYLRAGGIVTNGAGGLIEGYDGVRISGTTGTVINFGTVVATATDGVGVNLSLGSVTNYGSILVTGANGTGIDVNSGQVVNTGTILALSGTAVSVYYGAFSNQYPGLVEGRVGVILSGGGTVSNGPSALIDGLNLGVEIAGTTGAGTVVNFGTIEGYYDGVKIANTGAAAVVNYGTIASTSTSSSYGFYAGIILSGAASTVTNFGTITGTRKYADGIKANGSGVTSVGNEPGALISGAYDGIDLIDSAGTVSNSGTIEGAGLFGQGAGVSLSPSAAGASVTNAPGGLIVGAASGILLQGTLIADGTITNLGTVEGIGIAGPGFGVGVDAIGSNSFLISNAPGALIAGGEIGLILFAAKVAVDNSGTIQGMGTGISDAAIVMGAQGGVATVTNEPGGLIAGEYNGVFMPSFPSAGDMVTNLGTITGLGRAGVYISNPATVVNGATNATSALISDPQVGVFIKYASAVVTNFGNVAATANYGSGIRLTAGTVTNRGTVVGGSNGTGIYLASGNVTNYGTIIATGPLAKAVYVRYGTFFNYGVVEGSVFGIELSSATSGAGGGTVKFSSGTVNVAGTVTGATGIGVVPGDAGQTVTVSGVVTGTAGTAASLGGGNNRLIVDPGAVFSGTLDGGGGASVLEIGALSEGSEELRPGRGQGSVAYVSLGSVTNFSALQIDPSATLDSSGALSFDTLINQGQVNIASGDSLALGDVAAAASTGIIDLRTGAMIDFEGPVANQILEFNPAGGSAAIDQPAEFGGSITDFAAADTIDLALGTATDPQYSGGVLSLSYDGATVELSVATAYVVPQFLLAGDNNGGTDITVEEAPPPAVTEALVDDTGSSNTDKVTSNPAVGGSGDPDLVVTITEGGNTLGTVTANSSGAWSFTPTGLADGVHTLVASETDAAGNTGTASLSFTLKTAAPAPAVLALAPASDSGVQGDDITNVTTPVITGTGEIGDTVTLDDGSAAIGQTTVAGDGSWSVTTNALASETHSLTATEIDVAGNVSPASAALSLIVKTSAPAPAALALSPASDSGVQGDDITNVTNPVITGTGEAGDTVTLDDGSTAIGRATVANGGAWSVTANALASETHSLTATEIDIAGNVSAASSALSLEIDTTPPAIAAAAPLTVAGNSGATAIGIPAPTDALALTVTVTGLPTDGKVLLSGGGTAVSSGQTLSIAQLTGLEFRPTANLFGQSGTFTYSATDAAGNTAFGSATLAIEDQTACYCRGTLILTERGEVAVEDLAIGDKVVTISGEAKPIRWIGWRSYRGRFVAGNRAVLPIRVAAGALAEGVPARDLSVSPEHALYIDGALVPARLIVNGATIAQAEAVERVDYFHLELDAHEIIFAEGMPAETFVDCDNRCMFHNAGEFTELHPGDRQPGWEFCAPRLEWGSEELTAIRAALLQRAETLGHAFDGDPDLHLIVDGAAMRPDAVVGCVHRFVLPAGSRAVWLASRSAVPAETTAAGRDRRRLGVAVERIALSDGDLSIAAWHGHAGLREGFHADEGSHRWTDGLARLPGSWLGAFPGAVTLDLHLVASGLRYPIPAVARVAAAA